MKLQFKVIYLVVALALTRCSQNSPEELLTNAQQQVALNQASNAIIDLKNLLTAEPRNSEARFLLGELYLGQGEAAFAEKELQLAVDLGKNIELVLPKLLKSLNLQDKKSDILPMIELHKNGHVELMPQVLFYVGLANIDADKISFAKAAFTKANEISPESNYSKLGSAYLKLASQNIDEALFILEDILDEDPLVSEALMLKGNLLHLKKDYPNAIKAFQQYHKLLPKYLKVRMFLARDLIQDKQFAEATKQLDYLVKRFPEQPYVNQLKGVIAFEEGNYELSLLFIEKAIQNGINSPFNRVIAGTSAFLLQKYEIAYQYLVNTAEQLSANHPVKKILAMVQIQLGNTEDATLILSDLETLTTEDVNLLTTASYELMKSGKSDQAKLLLDKTQSIVGVDAQELTEIGILQLSVDDLNGIINLENALEISPKLPMAKIALAAAYISNQEYDKALGLAKKWKEDEPSKVEGYNLTAKILFLNNQIDKAEKELNLALTINEHNAFSLLYFANKALVDKSPKEALKFLDKLFVSTMDHLTGLAINYRAHKALSTSEVAIDKISKSFSNNQQNVSLRLLYSRVLFIEGQFDDVIDLLKETKGETPALQWALLGESYLKLSKNKEALNVYGDWIKDQPQYRIAWLRKISTQEKLNNYSGALTTIELALVKSPQDQLLNLMRANYLVLTQKFTEAQSQIDKLSEEQKSSPVVRGLQAQVWLSKGHFELAIPGLKELYQLSPNPYNTTLLFANYRKLKQDKSAFEFIQKHVTLYPDDNVSRNLLAENAIAYNKVLAKQHFLILLKRLPNNLSILNNLAWVEYLFTNYKEADVYIKKAMEINAIQPQVLDTAASIQLKLGNKTKALELLEKAKSLAPNDDEIAKHYEETIAQ
jgi:putative PEP-CTERM system TPR-repeat lipoprotein